MLIVLFGLGIVLFVIGGLTTLAAIGNESPRGFVIGFLVGGLGLVCLMFLALVSQYGL